jgi:hypothetical protein
MQGVGTRLTMQGSMMEVGRWKWGLPMVSLAVGKIINFGHCPRFLLPPSSSDLCRTRHYHRIDAAQQPNSFALSDNTIYSFTIAVPFSAVTAVDHRWHFRSFRAPLHGRRKSICCLERAQVLCQESSHLVLQNSSSGHEESLRQMMRDIISALCALCILYCVFTVPSCSLPWRTPPPPQGRAASVSVPACSLR